MCLTSSSKKIKTPARLLLTAFLSLFYLDETIADEKTEPDTKMSDSSKYFNLIHQQQIFQEGITASATQQQRTEYTFAAQAQAYVAFFNNDPNRPEFRPIYNGLLNTGTPNPDTTHYYVALRGDASYRLSGQRGSVHLIDFQTGNDWFGLAEKLGESFPSRSIKEFDVDKDGSFEILLSPTKPENYNGNWMELNSRADYLLVRQITYNPEETLASIAIERIDDDTSSVVEPATQQDFDAQISTLVTYVENLANISERSVNALQNNGSINQFETVDLGSEGGLDDQVYDYGLYDVSLDEALLVTVKVPDECAYWSIQTSDLLWRTHEFMYAQSSLNGHIDRSDADGNTRLVLSHRDPGVENWVDLTGIEQGYMLLRWLSCNETAKPVAEKIKLDQLDKNLPADTRRVTKEQRQKALGERVTARQLRRNW